MDPQWASEELLLAGLPRVKQPKYIKQLSHNSISIILFHFGNFVTFTSETIPANANQLLSITNIWSTEYFRYSSVAWFNFYHEINIAAILSTRQKLILRSRKSLLQSSSQRWNPKVSFSLESVLPSSERQTNEIMTREHQLKTEKSPANRAISQNWYRDTAVTSSSNPEINSSRKIKEHHTDGMPLKCILSTYKNYALLIAPISKLQKLSINGTPNIML